MVLCLVAAVVYSISLVLQKPLVAQLPAIHVTWLACTVGAVVCLPFVGQLVDDTASASASDVWWVVYLGVFPTAIAFTTFAYALRTMSASSLGVTTYLVPPITIVMGWLFLERDPARHGVRRRRARAGRRGRRPPQAAHPGRGATPAVLSPAMIWPWTSSRTSWSAWSPPCISTSWCSRCSSGTPRPGTRRSASTPRSPTESKALAANQGLYNGFLVAGLVWGLVDDRDDVKLFFLACVIVAGAYGAVTVSRRILVVQALPALVAFVLVLAAS